MKTKTVKIALEGYGSYLGMEKGCFVVKNREGKTDRYPLFENLIDEIRIKSGNSVSSGALASCGFWGIDCVFLTQKGRPVAMLRSLDDDSHVKTRICQYEALKNEKGLEIAKHIVLAKIEGQNQALKKYGLKSPLIFNIQQQIKAINGDLNHVRARLMSIEGHQKRTKRRHWAKPMFIIKIKRKALRKLEKLNPKSNYRQIYRRFLHFLKYIMPIARKTAKTTDPKTET